MSEGFTGSTRERFRKLLLLAAQSPFAGERAAALAAADRLAARHGLSLEEAARLSANGHAEPRRRETPEEARQRAAASAWARAFHRAFHQGAESAAASRARQQARWAEEEAERRREAGARRASAWKNGRRRLPAGDFARVLILETGFSLSEISRITGLSLHDLVSMKLRLRPLIG